MFSLIAQLRKCLRFAERDSLVVTSAAQSRGMTVHMTCPWCEDDAAFEIDEARDELVCGGCEMRTAFAPDPATTFGLLYEPVAA
jgi:hypothetical protein